MLIKIELLLILNSLRLERTEVKNVFLLLYVYSKHNSVIKCDYKKIKKCTKTILLFLCGWVFMFVSNKRQIGGINRVQRNWVFATNSDFLITISLEPNVEDPRYFKLWTLLDQIFWAWNIKGLQHQVPKI